MPTYQYTCTECANDLEAVQKFTDDALTECPECKGRLRKVFSAVGVVFKGSGFYRTDSRAKSSAADTAKSSASSEKSSSGESGSSAKSESSSSEKSSSADKPAAKSASGAKKSSESAA